MRVAFYLFLGVAVAGIAYSIGPDFVRYMKIKCM